MFKFTGFYLRTGLFWRPYLQSVKRDVEWLGLPYPPRRPLRCEPYRESLGSLRAYYYNPHTITITAVLLIVYVKGMGEHVMNR